MNMREQMARAGYRAAIHAPIPGALDVKAFNPDDAIHQWENQPEELRELWRAVVDAMLDVLTANPSEEILEAGDSVGSDNAEDMWPAMIRAIRDNK